MADPVTLRGERFDLQPVSREQLRVLSARIEGELARPAALMVTSAVVKDGKTFIVSSLAANLARSGMRVLLVDAAESETGDRFVRNAPKLSALAEFDIGAYITPATSAAEPDRLGLWGAGVSESASLENVRATLDALRKKYDYVLIDTSPAHRSALATSLASVADAVLISFRLGRAATSADRDLKEALASIGASVLGLVTVDAKAIAAFRADERAANGAVRKRSRFEDAVKPNTSVSVSL